MGVRWETEKPSTFLRRKQKRLRNHYIPLIHKGLLDEAHDRIVGFTPIGVKWVPKGSATPTARPSGALQRSIKTRRRGYGTHSRKNIYGGHVYTEKDYAPFVEYDTRPHPIESKGKSLYFFWGKQSRWSNYKSVWHPGTTGAHMFRRGIAATRLQVQRIGRPHLARWASER